MSPRDIDIATLVAYKIENEPDLDPNYVVINR